MIPEDHPTIKKECAMTTFAAVTVFGSFIGLFAACEPSPDWLTVLVAWGPAAPMLLFFLHLHRDVINRVIPGGFKLIQSEMIRQGRESAKRHREHISETKALKLALIEVVNKHGIRGKQIEETTGRRKGRSKGTKPSGKG